MNDYYVHETGRLGECMNLIFALGNKQRQQELIKRMNENSSLEKTISLDDLPESKRSIFVKMGNYLRKKDLGDFLCEQLVYRD